MMLLEQSDSPSERILISGDIAPRGKLFHPIQQSILPLFAKFDDRIVPAGTGFMISPSGLMVTAAHVLAWLEKQCERSVSERGQTHFHGELFAVYTSGEYEVDGRVCLKRQFMHGSQTWHNPNLDIGFVRLFPPHAGDKRFLFPTLTLSPGIPSIGDRIHGFGYHSMEGEVLGGLSEEDLSIRYVDESRFNRGQVLELYNPLRDTAMLPFPSFRTDARIEHGMSGSPIFNKTGIVCGVMTSGMDVDNYVSLLWPAMGENVELPLEPGAPPKEITIYDLIRRGYIAADGTLINISVDLQPDGLYQTRHVDWNSREEPL